MKNEDATESTVDVDVYDGEVALDWIEREIFAQDTEFSSAGEIGDLSDIKEINPLNADIQLARITRLGHRDKFPRPYDWENLVPLLNPGEELLWIVSKHEGECRVYLGVKFERTEQITLRKADARDGHFAAICNAFARRAFPESRYEKLNSDQVQSFLVEQTTLSKDGLTCITGIPSPKRLTQDQLTEDRDEEKRTESGLNDIVESLMGEGDYTVVSVLARAEPAEVRRRFEAKAAVRSDISPLIKQEFNSGETKGTNKGENIQQSRAVLPKMAQLIAGTYKGNKEGRKWGTRPVPSLQYGKSHQENKSISHSLVNARLEFLDEQIKLSMQHLQQAAGTGGYYGSVLVYAKSEQARGRLANTLTAALSGTHSYIRPMQALPFSGPGADFYFKFCAPVHKVIDQIGLDVEILTCGQAQRLFLLPDRELPGCGLKRSVFYGQPESGSCKSSGTILGNIAFDGVTTLGLSAKDLCSHLFLVGTTGSGKSERAVSILNSIPRDEFQVIVLETAKKTYRDRLFRGEAPLVYTLGDSTRRPLRINPFYFDPGTSLKRHISVLSDAMSELLPVEALIGPKLREAIEACYRTCQWDMERSEYFGDAAPRYPDMTLFIREVYRICESLEDYGAEVKGNYKGALLNRARLFIDDVYQDIFAFEGNLPFDELFPRDTIIEMEEMPPSDINMPAFIVSILLERLRAARFLQQQQDTKRRKSKGIVLAIEEAHNILHRKFEQATDERQAGRGKRLIEQVVRLLQEGRGLGISVVVVDQSAQYLADAVIANTNTKIVHRQEDGNEVETVGKALGLPEDDRDDLQKLEDGECIIKSKAFSRPIKLVSIPEKNLQRTRKWDPFLDVPPAPPYHLCYKLLSNLIDERWSLSAVLQAGEGIADLLKHDTALMRHVVGRFIAIETRFPPERKEELLQLSCDVQGPSTFEEVLWFLRPAPTQDTSAFNHLLFHLFGLGGREIQNALIYIQENKKSFGPMWLRSQVEAFLQAIQVDMASLNLNGSGSVYAWEWFNSVTEALYQWLEACNNESGGPPDYGPLIALKLNRGFTKYLMPVLFSDYAREKHMNLSQAREGLRLLQESTTMLKILKKEGA